MGTNKKKAKFYQNKDGKWSIKKRVGKNHPKQSTQQRSLEPYQSFWELEDLSGHMDSRLHVGW